MKPIYVEWEVTMKCNYKCAYCTNLDKTLKPTLDKAEIDAFIASLGVQYPGVEIFVFGGEPFVHPYIGYIIECFNKHNVPFVIQTNFSSYSVDVMNSISEPFAINISVHPTEVDLAELLDAFSHSNVTIKTIDVMYVGKKSMEYYLALKKHITHDRLFMIPVTDFGDGESDIALAEYNKMRDTPYSRIIQFEQVQRFGRYRSDLWADKKFITFGKPCLYAGRYFLYGPDLTLYNCCYREKTNGICQQEKCFLM